MRELLNDLKNAANRRSFLTKGMAAGTVTVGSALLGGGPRAFADNKKDPGDNGGKLTKGDAALLRFAAAAEILEADFWIQYNELGGIQDSQVPGGSGNPAYTDALEVLDEDFPQIYSRQHRRRDHSFLRS